MVVFVGYLKEKLQEQHCVDMIISEIKEFRFDQIQLMDHLTLLDEYMLNFLILLRKEN